jgi:SAM-dependent methyltransferase
MTSLVTSASRLRWDELLRGICALLPAGTESVLVEGDGAAAAVLAARLAATLNANGRPRVQVSARDEGNSGPWDVVIGVRTALAAAGARGRREEEIGAAIVVDMHDPDWPVIRRVAAPLAGRGRWYLAETRAFFAARAATWDTKFGDDMPAYAAAVARAGLPPGGTVVDVGCGTGRALPALRAAVGPDGAVVAIDITPEMLREASCQGRAAHAALILADARHLPLAGESADAVFAAGLVTHLPDIEAGLGELARITRQGGALVLFHPSGRAALAARHGRVLAPDDPLAADTLRRSTRASGWDLTTYDDAADHFFALALRR